MWFVLEDEELDRGNGRKVEVKWSTEKTIDSSNDRLYYEVTSSSWEKHDHGGLQSIVKNDILCGNDRRDIGRGISKAVQR